MAGAAVTLVAVLLVVWSVRRQSAATASSVGAGAGARVEFAGDNGAGVLVDVGGSVRRPGVYRLRMGARVGDAIRRAGGVSRRADLTLVNRAARLVDGQQVLVPARVRVVMTAPGVSSAAAGTPEVGRATLMTPVSINAGTIEQLDQLPGIGPVTAQHIVDDRQRNGPFASIDDLDRVPGIGAVTIEQLRSAVTL